MEVNLQFPYEVPHYIIKGDVRRSVFLTIKELLHNVVKHAQATHVSITTQLDDNLTIQVHDNGIGFEISNVKKGNGLKNMQKRMEKLQGTFIMENNNGTYIRLQIPIQNLH